MNRACGRCQPAVRVWLLKFRVHTRLADLRRQRRSQSMPTPRILTFMSTSPGTRIGIRRRRLIRNGPGTELRHVTSRNCAFWLRKTIPKLSRPPPKPTFTTMWEKLMTANPPFSCRSPSPGLGGSRVTALIQQWRAGRAEEGALEVRDGPLEVVGQRRRSFPIEPTCRGGLRYTDGHRSVAPAEARLVMGHDV